MRSSRENLKEWPAEPEERVSLGIVLSVPGSKVGEIIAYLESVENARLIYKKAALYELFITPYPPSCWKNKGE